MDLKPTVLIVEDDNKLRGLINTHLAKHYHTILASNFKTAIHEINRLHIDVACLDIGLPDGNGIDLCRIIKEDHSDTKVIVLSKRALIVDRLIAFNTGADDYLPKPFFFEELIIRIDKLLPLSNNKDVYRKGEFTLDSKKGAFSYKLNTVSLTRHQAIIMLCILSNGSRYCPLDNIIMSFNSYTLKRPSKNGMKVTISRLRAKFKREWGTSVIYTKYDYGYYLKTSEL